MKPYPDVDAYLADARRWHDETVALRAVVLGAGLDEAIKWGKPCYSFQGGNVAIIQPFKPHLALMFFKGTLMRDPEGLLVPQGENSQAAMRVEFTSVDEVAARADAVRALLAEAVELERTGAKVTFRQRAALELPEKLVDAFDANPNLRSAWDGLTPGRQRAYVLHIAGAKKAETRAARVAKCAPGILAGKGFGER